MLLYLWLLLATLSVFIWISDANRRHISNFNCMCVFILCVVIFIHSDRYISMVYVAPYSAACSVLYTMFTLVGGFILNRLNVIGGGDAKLLFAFSIAIAPNYLAITIMLIAVIGGLQAVLLVLFSYYQNKPCIRGVPYGFAICVGCLFGIAASI